MNGDGHLDLVAAHIGFENRVYLGDGAGNFGAGTDISADTNLTSSIAAGDVNGDGALDVIAGDSSFAVAGSASYFDVTVDGKAYIGTPPTCRSDHSVHVIANDDARVVALAGADVASNTIEHRPVGREPEHPAAPWRPMCWATSARRRATARSKAARSCFVQAIARDDLVTLRVRRRRAPATSASRRRPRRRAWTARSTRTSDPVRNVTVRNAGDVARTSACG